VLVRKNVHFHIAYMDFMLITRIFELMVSFWTAFLTLIDTFGILKAVKFGSI